jgi:hypothetical protein
MAALALRQLVQRVVFLVLEPTAATYHTPPAPRLRLLLVGGVSCVFSFQFFTCLAAVFVEKIGLQVNFLY